VQIASQHAEAVSEGPRDGVEEGLLLDRIALDATDVSPRNIKFAAAVIADLAYTSLAFGDGAGMSAGVAAEAIAVEGLDQFRSSLTDVTVQNVFEGWHLIGILLL